MKECTIQKVKKNKGMYAFTRMANLSNKIPNNEVRINKSNSSGCEENYNQP